VTPHLVNVINYGYTRLGGFHRKLTAFPSTPRIFRLRPAAQRVAPNSNFVDDLDVDRWPSSVQFGMNFRFSENDRLPNFPVAQPNTLLGLGMTSATT
jgi:hypothetical protein